jgi:hypothetical protein
MFNTFTDPNMPQENGNPFLWEMVALLVAQLPDTQAALWSTFGAIQLLRQYPDGMQALIEWKFGPEVFERYVTHYTDDQRLTFIAAGVALIAAETRELMQLQSLQPPLRLIGYLPTL